MALPIVQLSLSVISLSVRKKGLHRVFSSSGLKDISESAQSGGMAVGFSDESCQGRWQSGVTGLILLVCLSLDRHGRPISCFVLRGRSGKQAGRLQFNGLSLT